jgi:predicted RNase H-like HicB family nuclease
MSSYIALLWKDAASDYSVAFPDFPGCVTAGRTLDEAKRLAAEALAFHVEGKREDGEALPKPSSLDRIMSDPGNRKAVAFLVGLPPRRERSRPVTLTLKPSMLSRIDASAAAANVTRSAWLAEAAREKLARKAKGRRGSRA